MQSGYTVRFLFTLGPCVYISPHRNWRQWSKVPFKAHGFRLMVTFLSRCVQVGQFIFKRFIGKLIDEIDVLENKVMDVMGSNSISNRSVRIIRFEWD